MIENVLSRIGGVGAYGVISICLFFAFFVGMLLWALCLKRPYLNAMCQLPLEGDTEPNSATQPPTEADSRHE